MQPVQLSGSTAIFSSNLQRVFWSRELLEKEASLSEIENSAIHDIHERLEHGKTITPYLSKMIYDSAANCSDCMLNNWNIYHAHLGVLKPRGTECERSDNLLFFTSDRNNHIYFIDVMRHPKGNEWFNRKLLELVDDNWPNLLCNLKSVKNTSLHNISDKDHYVLQKKNIGCFLEIHGKTVVPNIVTSSGDTFFSVRWADKCFAILRNFKPQNHSEEYALRDDGEILSIYKKSDGSVFFQIRFP